MVPRRARWRWAGRLLLVDLGLTLVVAGTALALEHYPRRAGVEHAVTTAVGCGLVLLGLAVAIAPTLLASLTRRRAGRR